MSSNTLGFVHMGCPDPPVPVGCLARDFLFVSDAIIRTPQELHQSFRVEAALDQLLLGMSVIPITVFI